MFFKQMQEEINLDGCWLSDITLCCADQELAFTDGAIDLEIAIGA